MEGRFFLIPETTESVVATHLYFSQFLYHSKTTDPGFNLQMIIERIQENPKPNLQHFDTYNDALQKKKVPTSHEAPEKKWQNIRKILEKNSHNYTLHLGLEQTITFLIHFFQDEQSQGHLNGLKGAARTSGYQIYITEKTLDSLQCSVMKYHVPEYR